MYRPTTPVVSADAYRAVEKPYDVSASVAAALADLTRRRKAQAAQIPARPRVVDREAARIRIEAEAMRKEAARILEDARKRTAAMERESRAASEELRKTAREEGFSQGLEAGSTEGYEKGLRQGEQEGLGQWAELLARWQGLLDATVKEKEQYFADRERVLIELVMKVSAKVLGRELKTSPVDVKAKVVEAIRRCNDRASLVIRLNPEDLAKALEGDAQGLRSTNGVKQMEFLADEKVIRGGVRIESGTETVDAAMESQLTEIIKGLLQEAYHAD